MELRQIRHFLAIVEEENFVLAARRVCISQPALSRSLRMLEAALKVRLIERGLRRSVPSVAGERFLPYARAILANCERAQSVVQDTDCKSARLVTLGITAPLSSWVALRIAARIPRELPGVQICFREGTPEDLLGLLRAGRIPLALSTLSCNDMDPLVATEALTQLRSVVVGPPKPGPVHLTGAPARALLPSRWVTLDGLDDHIALHEHFSQRGLGIPCVTLAGSLGHLRSLITDGHTALVPAQLLRAELRRGDFRMLDFDIPQGARAVAMLYLNNTPKLPHMECVKAIVRDCVKASETEQHADAAGVRSLPEARSRPLRPTRS
jgi:DNA-binding transcriptional LysR family regulator